MRVVSLDLDGTLIHPAIFNAVADALGFGAPLRASYEAWAEGRMTLEAAFHHDYAHFVGRRVEDCRKALRATKAWTPGIGPAVHVLHTAGLRVVLTTDQPRFLAEATRDFGVDDLVCTEAAVEDGYVSAKVEPRFAKWPNLESWLARGGIDPRDVCHVGNGTNDVPVFQRVGYSIAVNPTHESVANAADDVLDPMKDLRQVADLVLARHEAERRG